MQKKGTLYTKLCRYLLNATVVLGMTNATFASDGGGAVIPDDVIKTLTTITSILLLVASAVCIGKIIHIGIMFVTSSAVEKSKAKEALFPWILGTIVCFGAATIGSAIVNIFLNAVPHTSVLDY